MIRSYSILVVVAALVLSACDGGDTDEPLAAAPGRFSATVTIDGGDRVDLDGSAFATPSQLIVLDSVFVSEDSLITIDSIRTGFMVTLGTFAPTGPGYFISLMREGDRPDVGTYALGGGFERDEFSAFFSSFDRTGTPGLGDAFVAESGTLTVEASSETRVAGRFEFRARTFDFDGEGEAIRMATVRGAFDAQIRAFPAGFPRGYLGGDL